MRGENGTRRASFFRWRIQGRESSPADLTVLPLCRWFGLRGEFLFQVSFAKQARLERAYYNRSMVVEKVEKLTLSCLLTLFLYVIFMIKRNEIA